MASYTSYMSSSRSPDQGPATSEADDKTSPSSLDPNILQTLAEKRTTRDGNPPKKRGPKPNSKPAMSRRQELNRQAQRTHRLRKEGYIKALEDEVLRLKEVYSTSRQGREKLAEENKQLRDALARYGIPVDSPGSTTSYAPGSSSTHTPPFTASTATPSIGSSSHASPGDRQQMSGHQLRDMTQQASGRGMDVEQAGIDFVLALEQPCKAHLQFMMERKADPEGGACGHALMATCPAQSFPESMPDLSSGQTDKRGDGVWSYDVQPTKADLATLLDLSSRLDLDGEVTPIMAWGMVLAHPRVHELRPEHLKTMAEEMVQKVRCYGFGAVMEEFEVRDALDSVFA